MALSVIYDTPDNPAPGTARVGCFEAADGTGLRYALFAASGARNVGTVVLIQGRTECIEKYYETIDNLIGMGLSVATFDLRGQGGSDRLIEDSIVGHVGRFTDYENDLEQFLDTIVMPDMPAPFFIVAHSTGGLIALSAGPRLKGRIARMVLAAPFVSIGAGRLRETLARLFARAAVRFGHGDKTPAELFRRNPPGPRRHTCDAVRLRRNRAIAETHPELAIGAGSMRWLSETLEAIHRVRDPGHLAAIEIPALLLGAGSDGVVEMETLETLAANFRAGKLVVIDRARHELLQEADIYRKQALAAIDAFIPGNM